MDQERARGARSPDDRSNPYCDALGIGIPKLEVAKDHPEANYYSTGVGHPSNPIRR